MKIEIYDSGGKTFEVNDHDPPPKTIRLPVIGDPFYVQEYELQYYVKFNMLTNKVDSQIPYYIRIQGR